MENDENKDCNNYQQINQSYSEMRIDNKQALYDCIVLDKIKVIFRCN